MSVVGRFTGRVVFESQKPARVGLWLKATDGEFQAVLLNDDGSFDVRGIKPGTYELSLSGRGYEASLEPDTVHIGTEPVLGWELRAR